MTNKSKNFFFTKELKEDKKTFSVLGKIRFHCNLIFQKKKKKKKSSTLKNIYFETILNEINHCMTNLKVYPKIKIEKKIKSLANAE